MAAHRNTFGLAQIAADATPRIELRDVYENAFTLVVGDTFADRVVFWNLRSRDPAFLGREPTTVIVPPSRLEDPTFFAALADFLKKRNGVPRSSGTPWVQLCSASATTEQLNALRDRFRAVDKWNGYQVAPPVTLDSITPSAKLLERSLQLVTGDFIERAPEWKELTASGDKVQLSAAIPRHIAHVDRGR
jgi:hypothetical protein